MSARTKPAAEIIKIVETRMSAGMEPLIFTWTSLCIDMFRRLRRVAEFSGSGSIIGSLFGIGQAIFGGISKMRVVYVMERSSTRQSRTSKIALIDPDFTQSSECPPEVK